MFQFLIYRLLHLVHWSHDFCFGKYFWKAFFPSQSMWFHFIFPSSSSLVSRPQPLSTISKRSANEKVMSRAGFINNVLNKIEEVWLGKGATPESSPSRRWAEIKKDVFVVSRFWITHSLIHSFIHLFLIARELLRFRSPNPLWPFQTPSWELRSPWPQNESQGSVLRDPQRCTGCVEMG